MLTQPYQSRRQKSFAKRSKSPKKIKLMAGAILVILALVAGIIYALQADKPTSQHYFVDSKYQGISSKFVVEKTKDYESNLEYPVTKNDLVNKTTADYIDGLYGNFKTEVTENQPSNKSQFAANYNIYTHSDTIISLYELLKLIKSVHTMNPLPRPGLLT